jgi:hypothetical protein
MPPRKTTTLNLRVDPAIKETLREAAHRENRSIANMIELLIRRHCELDQLGITGLIESGTEAAKSTAPDYMGLSDRLYDEEGAVVIALALLHAERRSLRRPGHGNPRLSATTHGRGADLPASRAAPAKVIPAVKNPLNSFLHT